ncbi:MAG: DUF1737 domain-containing protein [Sphingobacterium sp.]|jgi:hypothetical protein|nr:DUF1737 domain-containing protein [Sphingobacterium sp.]
MEYKVISSYELKHLVEEVNEHLLQGWKLQGGMSASSNAFYQALIKEK